MTDEPQLYEPGPDDFNFRFNDLVERFAVVGALVRPMAKLDAAARCYEAISGEDLSRVVMPEHLDDTLRDRLHGLVDACAHWKDMPVGDVCFQEDYARLVTQACDDLAIPMAAVDEAANVVRRALTERNDDGQLLSTLIADVDYEELLKTYQTFDEIRRALRQFHRTLEPIIIDGNFIASNRADGQVSREALGRPISHSAENNPYHRMELLFFGISAIMSAEREELLKTLRDAERQGGDEETMRAFHTAIGTVAGYAKYELREPEDALRLLKPQLPGCLKAFEVAHERTENKSSQALIEILKGCFEQLQHEPGGPERGPSHS